MVITSKSFGEGAMKPHQFASGFMIRLHLVQNEHLFMH